MVKDANFEKVEKQVWQNMCNMRIMKETMQHYINIQTYIHSTTQKLVPSLKFDVSPHIFYLFLQ
jgi:hypothetical protein